MCPRQQRHEPLELQRGQGRYSARRIGVSWKKSSCNKPAVTSEVTEEYVVPGRRRHVCHTHIHVLTTLQRPPFPEQVG